MDQSNRKRSRSSNWDEEEKALFVECLREEIKIIENKKKLTVLNKDKNAAWERVRAKMEIEGYNRDIQRMKEQWQRMKVQSKKNISQYKKTATQTGGGPPSEQPTDLEWKIKDLVPHEFVDDTSRFDSDHVQSPPPVLLTFMTKKPLEMNLEASTTSSRTTTIQSFNEEQFEEVVNIDGIMSELVVINEKVEESDIRAIVDESKGVNEREFAAIRHKNKIKKSYRTMSEYEKKLCELNQKRMEQTMKHAQELHMLKMKNEKEYHEERIRLLRKQLQ